MSDTFFKYTALLESAGPPASGWSESLVTKLELYENQAKMDEYIQNLWKQRMKVAHSACTLVGLKRQLLDGKARPVLTGFTLSGIGTKTPDPCFQSALLHCSASNGSRRQMKLPGLPDEYATGDRLVLDTAGKRAFLALEAELKDNIFIRSYDRDQPKVALQSFTTSSRIVQTVAAHGLAAGDHFRFLNVRDPNGKAVSGTFMVKEVVDANNFKVYGNQPAEDIGAVGSIRKIVPSYVPIVATQLDQTVQLRKVGRPFFGRHAKKSSGRR